MHRRCINWLLQRFSILLRWWKKMEDSMLRLFNKHLAGASSAWLECCDANPSPACCGGEGGMCGWQYFSSMAGLGGQPPRSATSPATLSATISAEGQPLHFESAILAAVSKRRGESAAATLGQQIGPAALDQAGCSSFFHHVWRIFRLDAVESDKVLSAPSGLVPGASENSRIWNQGDAQGLDRVPRANMIIFRVQSVISETPVYIDGFAGVSSVILYPTPF
jgi:hypothetical protein